MCPIEAETSCQVLERRARLATHEARLAKLRYQTLRDAGEVDVAVLRDALSYYEACDTKAALIRWLLEKAQLRSETE